MGVISDIQNDLQDRAYQNGDGQAGDKVQNISVTDSLCEGPIRGLVGGVQGVYFNGTPVENAVYRSFDPGPFATVTFNGSSSAGTVANTEIPQDIEVAEDEETPTTIEIESVYSGSATISSITSNSDFNTVLSFSAQAGTIFTSDWNSTGLERLVKVTKEGAEIGGWFQVQSGTAATLLSSTSVGFSVGDKVSISINLFRGLEQTSASTVTIVGDAPPSGSYRFSFAGGAVNTNFFGGAAGPKTSLDSPQVQFRSGTPFQSPIEELGGVGGAVTGVGTSPANTDLKIIGSGVVPGVSPIDLAGLPEDNANDFATTATLLSSTNFGLGQAAKRREADEISFAINYSAMETINNNQGDREAAYAHYLVRIRFKRTSSDAFGAWENAFPNYGSKIIHKGKVSSARQFDHYIGLNQYRPFHDFEVQLVRLTRQNGLPVVANGGNGGRSDKKKWTTRVESVLGTLGHTIKDNLSYPYTAIASTAFSSKAFQRIPKRSYLVEGKLVQVPSSYTPREYSSDGVAQYEDFWDGSFKDTLQYTDNPAWVFYDIITNKRYGAGHWIQSNQINKYSLYRIAKYCDELVDDGNGGLEPRFRANVYLAKPAEIYKVAKDFATMFLGILYWMDGQLTAVNDAPQDPVHTFTKGNVINGEFTYESTNVKNRPNQVIVTYNDPDSSYEPIPLVVEDRDAITRVGRIITSEAVAFGATSEAQALRYGRWKLWTAQNQQEVVNFQTGLQGAYVRPGDIINVQDADRYGTVYSGRVKSGSAVGITLDRSITLNAGSQYYLSTFVNDTAAFLNSASAVTIGATTINPGEKVTSAYVYDTVNNDGTFDLVALDSEEVASNAFADSGGTEPLSLVWKPYSYVARKELNEAASNSSYLVPTQAFSGPEIPTRETIWSLSEVDSQGLNVLGSTKQYKVLGIKQEEENKFSIAGVEHYNSKFQAVEKDYYLGYLPDSVFPTRNQETLGNDAKPKNLRVFLKSTDTTQGEELALLWDIDDSVKDKVAGFEVAHNSDSLPSPVRVADQFLNLVEVADGRLEFRVRSVGINDAKSPWATFAFDVEDPYNTNTPRLHQVPVGVLSNVDARYSASAGTFSFDSNSGTVVTSVSDAQGLTRLTPPPSVNLSASSISAGNLAEYFVYFDKSSSSISLKYWETESLPGVPYWIDANNGDLNVSESSNWTSIGTVNVSANSNILQGTGFNSSLQLRDVINLSGSNEPNTISTVSSFAATIISIESDTSAILDRPFNTEISSREGFRNTFRVDYNEDALVSRITYDTTASAIVAQNFITVGLPLDGQIVTVGENGEITIVEGSITSSFIAESTILASNLSNELATRIESSSAQAEAALLAAEAASTFAAEALAAANSASATAAALENSLSAEVARLDAVDASLSAQLVTTASSVSTVQSDVQNLSDSLSSAQTDITALQNDVSDTQSSLETTRNSLSVTQVNVNSLSATVAGLEFDANAASAFAATASAAAVAAASARTAAEQFRDDAQVFSDSALAAALEAAASLSATTISQSVTQIAANSASAFAVASASSATSAATFSDSAQQFAILAQGYSASASTAASNAESSASSALIAANSASVSQALAFESRTLALSAAKTASTQAIVAQNAATTAQAFSNSSEAFALLAEEYSASAATQASNAAASASSALIAANSASASQALAFESANLSVSAAKSASSFAVAAQNSETLAFGYSASASSFAILAERYSASAATQASNAASSASSALVAADSASASEAAAFNSAQLSVSAAKTASTRALAAFQSEQAALAFSSSASAFAAIAASEAAGAATDAASASTSRITALNAAQTASSAAASAETFSDLAVSAANSSSAARVAAEAAAASASSALVAAESAAVPLGQVNLIEPREQWTDESQDIFASIQKPATEAGNGNFVLSDSSYGAAYQFNTTANITIGHAYPFDFAVDQIIEVQSQYRVIDDGTSGSGVAVRVGVTTQSATTIVQSNIQSVGTLRTISDGPQTETYWFGDSANVVKPATLPSYVDGFVELGSDTANYIYPAIRQNYTGGAVSTAGKLSVGTLRVRNVTDVANTIKQAEDAEAARLEALDSASAALTSATTAAASASAAGVSASVSTAERLLAQAASQSASNFALAAEASKTSASAFSSSSFRSSQISRSASLAAIASSNSAEDFALAAESAATSASAYSTSALNSSAISRSASLRAQAASSSAENFASAALDSKQSASAFSTSAGASATAANQSRLAAEAASQSAENFASAAESSKTSASAFSTSAEQSAGISRSASLRAVAASESADNFAQAAIDSAQSASAYNSSASSFAQAANADRILAQAAASDSESARGSADGFASAAFTSSQSAAAFRNEAGTSATAAESARLVATAASASAENFATAAAGSKTTASSFATSAFVAAQISRSASLRATAASQSASNFADAAINSAETASSFASSAIQAAAVSRSASLRATAASQCSGTFAQAAIDSAQSASAYNTSASGFATATNSDRLLAQTAAGSAATAAGNAEAAEAAASAAAVAALDTNAVLGNVFFQASERSAWSRNMQSYNLQSGTNLIADSSIPSDTYFTTSDATFGNAYIYSALNANETIGPRRVFPWNNDTVYFVRAVYRVTQDSTDGNENTFLGYNGWADDGANPQTTPDYDNQQPFSHTNGSVSTGVQTLAGFIAGNNYNASELSALSLVANNKDADQGNGASVAPDVAESSRVVTTIGFSLRQNASAALGGRLAVKSFEVFDVTAAIDAELSAVRSESARGAADGFASAAFTSSQSAAAFRNEAGNFATASESARTVATAASQSASNFAQAAENSKLSASAFSGSAFRSSQISRSASLRATAASNSAADFADAALQSAESASAFSSSAFNSAAISRSAGLAARTASNSAQTNAVAAAASSQSAKAASSSASAFANAANDSFLAAQAQSQCAVNQASAALASRQSASAFSSSAKQSSEAANTFRLSAEAARDATALVNLLPDGDFEVQGGNSEFSDEWDPETGRWELSTAQAHRGTYAAKITSTGATDPFAGVYNLNFAINSGDEFTLGMWVYNNTGGNVSFALSQQSGWASFATTSNGAWTFYQNSGSATANYSAGAISIDKRSQAVTSSTNLWIDEVVLVRGKHDLTVRTVENESPTNALASFISSQTAGAASQSAFNSASAANFYALQAETSSVSSSAAAVASIAARESASAFSSSAFNSSEAARQSRISASAAASRSESARTTADNRASAAITASQSADVSRCAAAADARASDQSRIDAEAAFDSASVAAVAAISARASACSQVDLAEGIATAVANDVRIIESIVTGQGNFGTGRWYIPSVDGGAAISTFEEGASLFASTQGDTPVVESMSANTIYTIASGSAAGGYVYGTGAISVLASTNTSAHGAMAVPQVFASNLNARIFDRYTPNKYFFWSPNSDASVDVYYTNSAYAAMNSLTPEDTFTISKGVEKSWSAGQLRAGGVPSSVTNITNGNPAVVSASSSEFKDGEGFVLSGITGGSNSFSQLNGTRYFADSLTASTFAIYTNSSLTTAVNTTSYSSSLFTSAIVTGDANNSQATTGMHVFISDAKILGWAYGSGQPGDYTALHPPTNTSLLYSNRVDKVRGIQLNSSSSTFTTYTNGSALVTVSEDPDLYLTSFGSGDGSGGDAEQGLGQEFLSDTYIFPKNQLSHYIIVATQPCEVKVTDGTGTLYTTENLLSASATNPVLIATGNAIGTPAISGITTGPYTFTGTAPFYLMVQSALDSRETVLLGSRQGQLGQFQQEAVARRFRGVQAKSDSAVALATTALDATVSNSQAIVSQVSTLNAAIKSNSALIVDAFSALATESAARVSAITSLTADVKSNSAAIVTTNDALATQSSAQVNFTQTLTANIGGGFDPAYVWNFNDGGLQGWSSLQQGSITNTGNNTITANATGIDFHIGSPTISLDGEKNRYVQMRVKRTAGTGWDGRVFWTNSVVTSFSGSYFADVDDTTILNEFVILEWDMFNATGATEWNTNARNVTRLRIDFGTSSADDFEVDWIQVGSKGGSDYRSAVQVEADARATADGILNAKYTVKIDNNGHIAGFGLASDSNSAGEIESRFIVRADSFAVVDPASPSESGGTTADLTTTNYNDSVPFVIEGGITKVKKVQADSITAQELEVSNTTSGANNSMYFSASSSIRIYDSSGQLRVHIGNLNDTQ